MASNPGPLTAAANALKSSEKAFPGSMAKSAGVKPASERMHEFAHAPYSMAKASPAPKPQSETDGIASGLKWRADQAKAIQDQ